MESTSPPDGPMMVYVVLGEIGPIDGIGRVEAVYADPDEAFVHSTMGDMQVVPYPVTMPGEEVRHPDDD